MAAKKTKKIDKVAIVGYAPSCVETPFNRDDMHFWGMNDLWSVPQLAACGSRWHAWFDLHQEHVMKQNPRTGTKHWDWLKAQDFPVYTLEPVESLDNAVVYPLEEVKALSWDPEKAYFTSTPAYMVALAILQGYKEIHLYGINLLGKDEYVAQRPNTEYWLGIAHGKGIKLVIPESSTILRSPYLYGYDTHGKELNPLHKHLKHKLIEHQQRLQAAKDSVQQLVGACEAMKYFDQMFGHHERGGAMPDAHVELPLAPELPEAQEAVRGWHEARPEEQTEHGPNGRPHGGIAGNGPEVQAIAEEMKRRAQQQAQEAR